MSSPKPTFTKLSTTRLTLKQITAQDIKNIYAGLSHPEVIRYYGVSYHTLEETKEQMEWYASLEKEGKGMWWGIWANEEDSFLGACGCYAYEQKHRKMEIGYWLLPEYWRKGYMKEALQVMISYLFDVLHIHRIEAFVEVGNENSGKLLRRLGFEYEGRMRECEIKNGAFISLDIFGKLAPAQ